jgi:tRNA G10  N-methylase Trm11
MFYHKDTLKEILAIRKYFIKRRKNWLEDNIDKWIEMVATNRLTGHSSWFFSVYTLPPNQALTKDRQILINQKRNQEPEYRNIKSIILKKSWTLLKNIWDKERNILNEVSKNAILLNNQAYNTKKIKNNSINLIVTSPPFLDVIKYTEDNWLRCWFNNIDTKKIKTTELKNIEDWNNFMKKVFNEFYRIIKKKWYIAFEVWEVKWWKINLDEHIVHIWLRAWFKCIWVLVNQQSFTKTANIWWVNNNNKWTNTNRIVLFQK